MNILLVEDETQLSDALKQILITNKCSVDAVFDGESGFEYGLTNIYDAIILDIMLPKMNGIEVLKNLRKNKINTPIIILTAKNSIEDKIVGLDSGADDYLEKPFSPDELLARLRAITRRNLDFVNKDIIYFSDINLNISTYELSCNNNSIILTLKEFEILRYFIQRPKAVVDKDDLIAKIWGFDSDVEYNNLEVYISFLRKKLSYIESNVKITTIRRVGYRLE